MVAQHPVECSCAHGNTPSVSIKDEYLPRSQWFLPSQEGLCALKPFTWAWWHCQRTNHNILLEDKWWNTASACSVIKHVLVHCQIYDSTNLTIFLSILGDIPSIQKPVKREPYKCSTRFTLPIPTPHSYTHFIFPIYAREQILVAYMTLAYSSFWNVTFSAFNQNRYTDEEMKYLCGISNKTPSLTNFAKKFAQSLRRVEHPV